MMMGGRIIIILRCLWQLRILVTLHSEIVLLEVRIMLTLIEAL